MISWTYSSTFLGRWCYHEMVWRIYSKCWEQSFIFIFICCLNIAWKCWEWTHFASDACFFVPSDHSGCCIGLSHHIPSAQDTFLPSHSSKKRVAFLMGNRFILCFTVSDWVVFLPDSTVWHRTAQGNYPTQLDFQSRTCVSECPKLGGEVDSCRHMDHMDLQGSNDFLLSFLGDVLWYIQRYSRHPFWL